MSDGSVIARPRKTKFDIDQEALTNTYNNDFGLIPENEWSAVDAATMGMSTPEIIARKTPSQSGIIETVIEPTKATGTDTGSGNREAPAPVARDRMAGASEDDRMAAWAKANPTLAAKVRPGQAGYDSIQKYLNPVTGKDVSAFQDDSGYTKEESSAYLNGGSLESVIDSSGISTTITTPQTTSNPTSLQDGTSAAPDVFDQSRTLSIPGVDPQQFLNTKMKDVLGTLSENVGEDKYIFE